jgi:hypothetical protein
MAAAYSCVPSSEDARLVQELVGADVCAQVEPELVEVYIDPPFTAATNLLPSAEDATQDQLVNGAVVCVQL